ERLRTFLAEINVAINVVLDQRDPVLREQFQDGLLPLVGHGAPQWVVEARREETRLDRRGPERSSQGREIDAATCVDRQYQRSQIEGFEHLQEAEVRRGLDRDRIAGP